MVTFSLFLFLRISCACLWTKQKTKRKFVLDTVQKDFTFQKALKQLTSHIHSSLVRIAATTNCNTSGTLRHTATLQHSDRLLATRATNQMSDFQRFIPGSKCESYTHLYPFWVLCTRELETFKFSFAVSVCTILTLGVLDWMRWYSHYFILKSIVSNLAAEFKTLSTTYQLKFDGNSNKKHANIDTFKYPDKTNITTEGKRQTWREFDFRAQLQVVSQLQVNKCMYAHTCANRAFSKADKLSLNEVIKGVTGKPTPARIWLFVTCWSEC